MAVNKIGRGIHKVGERVVQKGRALIITSENDDGFDWSEIPDGSLKINPKTGIAQIKLEGETDWVPFGTKNDGTLSIAKDSIVKEEKFTIVTPSGVTTASGAPGFTYKNTEGHNRTMPFAGTSEYVFELENGEYMPERNHLEIDIDGILERSVKGGEVRELSSKKFALKEPDGLSKDQVITVRYIQVARIGNPYPRVFYTANAPDAAEEGDIWLDRNGTIEDSTDEAMASSSKIPWSRVSGTPTSLSGYGITDKVSLQGHLHKWADISDRPTSLKANGGNADTLSNKRVGSGVNQIPYIQSNGKLDPAIVPTSSLKTLTIRHQNGTTTSYNGTNNLTLDMTQEIPSDSVFDSQGRLVFPNGNLFWIS